jgi:methyl-accepting chemotaxis protein
VRSLAQRSAQAAKEIKELIGHSVANVDQGARLVNDAGKIITEVTTSVEQVNELIGVIAVASREQSNGVDGVNQALTRLQGVTQHNADVVQQAAFASVTLKEEAGRLSEIVGRFRLDAAAAPAPAPVLQRASAQPQLAAATSRAVRPAAAAPAPAARADDWQEL